MAAHSTIIFITSLYYLHLFADGRILPLNAADEGKFQPLCSRMCDSSRDFRDNILFPYDCSCSQSCAVFDDCCYDSLYKGEKKTSEFFCVSVDGLGDFRVVSNCPLNKLLDSCRENLGSLPPVTSRITNITYGNAFCASCNNDADYLTTWNVQLRCSSKTYGLEYGFDFNEITYYEDEFKGRNAGEKTWRPCKFYVNDGNSKLLRDLELRPCHTPPNVFRCSPTWRDLSVKEKCRSYADPVYIQDKHFRNSHCAKCNYMNLDYIECIPSYAKKVMEDQAIRSCIVRSRYRWHHCIHDAGRGPRYSFDRMFQLTSVSCVPPDGKRCCDDERYDANTGKCRRVRKD